MADETKVEEKTEFDKQFDSVNPFNMPAVEKTTPEPEPEPVVVPDEKPVEIKEPAVEEERVDEKTVADADNDGKDKAHTDGFDKDKVNKKGKPIIGDYNGKTWKARHKTAEGIIKSEKAKREAAEKLAGKALADKEVEIARLMADFEKRQAEPAQATGPDPIDGLEEAFTEAVYNGDKPLAAKLRKQIREIERTQLVESLRQETDGKVSSMVSQLTEKQLTDVVVNKSISQYPFLDPSHEDADEDAILLVQAKRQKYQAEGMSKPAALETAVAEVAPRFAIKVKASTDAKPESESEIDPEKIAATVAVKTSSAPVRAGGRPKVESFDDAFNAVNPFGKK
jgi:hypothetical protein